jgi:hypothetical protein
MKSLSKIFLLSSFLIVALWSCKKDENKIYFEGGTPPAFAASIKDSIPLSFAGKDNEAIRISWTNPNYRMTTGVSSQDVAYLIEIDTAGANFTSPNKKSLAVSRDLGMTFTQNEFNDILLNQLVLKSGVKYNIEMRVISTLGASKAVGLTSNVLKFAVTPYAIPPKVAPPTTGKLFIVGDATPGGWNNPVPTPAQEFRQVSPTMYEITLPLVGDKNYLLLPLNGDWGTKYGAMGGNNSNNVDGDDFRVNGGDLKAPAASGTYKIVVDFQRGKFTLTKI